MSERPVFYYDLASPDAWLVAERVADAFPQQPEWQPVCASDLGIGSWSGDRKRVEAIASDLSLLTPSWPQAPIQSGHEAILAATFAKSIGRTVAFSLAAFRQAFAAGRDLNDRDTILLAAAACEIHPRALIKALTMTGTSNALAAANERATEAGVTELPAVADGSRMIGTEELLVIVASTLSQS